MRGVCYTGEVGRVAVCSDAPIPTVGGQNNCVVIRVELCGLCGSDLHAYLGKEKGCAKNTISGHEAVGVVIETSSDCNSWKGKTVVVPFSTNCGSCRMCEASLPSRCESGQLLGWVDEDNGFGLQGCQAEYVLIPLAQSTLVEISSISPDIGIEDALLCGDILSTAYFSVMNGIQDTEDKRAPWKGCWTTKKLLIIGCGPVGLLATLCASYLVPINTDVYVYDLVDSRKQEATRFGATAITETDIKPIYDVVIECVGAKSALRSALSSVRPGGTISSIGVHTDVFPFVPSELYDSNACYRTGRCPARAIMPLLGPVLSHGSKILGTSVASWIISHRVALESAPEFYERFAARENGILKVVFNPSL